MDGIHPARVAFSPRNSFEEFTAGMERQLGRHDRSQSGASGLALFGKFDQSGLLGTASAPRSVLQYLVGDPLCAARMMEQNISASLYSLLPVLVYVSSQSEVRVEYDLPSSIFAQFSNARINAAARELDVSLANLVEEASQRDFPRLK